MSNLCDREELFCTRLQDRARSWRFGDTPNMNVSLWKGNFDIQLPEALI